MALMCLEGRKRPRRLRCLPEFRKDPRLVIRRAALCCSVLSEEGELHLVELNPDKLVNHGSVQVLSGKTWNNLCLYGKRLLVRNAEEAACFALP